MPQYSTNSWNTLSLPFEESIRHAIKQLHHSAQFVGMFSQAYLPKESDDSQSNLEWLPQLKVLASQQVQKNRVHLNYDSWMLQLLGAHDLLIASLSPEGKTQDEILEWFRFQLAKTPLAPQQYDYFNHFSLPSHPLDQGSRFEAIATEIRHELALYRQNAHWSLNRAIQPFQHAGAVRTWPHHFDIGSVITLQFAEDGTSPTTTIGLGWAIPGEEIEEPYYYINHWKQDSSINYDHLPELPEGCHWHQGNWTGPVLPLSSLLERNAGQQEKLVTAFFDTGIAASIHLLQQK